MNTLIPLSTLTRSDTSYAGVKAAWLGELARAGFNVPYGVVLTTHAYAEIIAQLHDRITARLSPDVIMDPAEIEVAAADIRAWLEESDWPPALQRALQAELANCGDSPSFAARTSVTSDDLATASGSGVERAYLGLVGLEQVQRAALRAWASLWNSRAMYYRYRKKIPQTDVALAVLVQPMVPARAAGVMFTQNPLTGDAGEIQIDSIWGLGAPLTGARVKPDRFLFDKSSQAIKSRTIQDKTVELIVTASGETEQQAVEQGRVAAPSLDDSQIAELGATAIRIEKHFGGPQDIEWAIANNQLYILQSRPLASRRT